MTETLTSSGDFTDRRAELAEKHERLLAWIAEHDLDAVLIARHENMAWVTAGLADVRVGVLRETGPASLLITRTGKKYCLTTNNEAGRLNAEEFAGLEYETLVNPWYANDTARLIAQVAGVEVAGGSRVAGDVAVGGSPAVSLYDLRASLTEGEMERYRWLGRHTADAAAEVLLALQPGMSERQAQALLAEKLLPKSIMPSVYLTAFDARARSYPHPVPRDGVLQQFGMVGLCARRWGLTVSITRFVHFGPMPQELAEKFGAVESVYERLLEATREGASSDELFGVVQREYARLGHAGAEQNHHQGGATGYGEREWFARPGGEERVQPNQAFAWNPNLLGAKTEDTVLLREGNLELLTGTPDLPTSATRGKAVEIASASVLMR